MNIEEAIKLLRQLVKESAVPGQKHLDFGQVPTNRKTVYEKAMGKVNELIRNGELSKEDFCSRVGLN